MKKLLPIILFLTTLCVLTSCDLFHEHTWQKNLIKAPSCTETGILKETCLECGEISLSEIAMSDHNYTNGICIYCGDLGTSKKELTPVSVPAGSNNDEKWMISKIYDISCSMGYYESYATFTSTISDTSIKNVKISNLGLLQFTVFCSINEKDYETPLMYSINKGSPDNPTAPLGMLLRADLTNGNLYLTYTTGVKMYAGTLSENRGVYITGFGINSDNELIIYYSNDTLAFAGMIPS